MKTVTMSVLFTIHSFCPTQRPVHRMLKKCWMNEQITNGWRTQRFISKTASHLEMHLAAQDKGFQFHSKDPISHTIHSYFSLFSCGPSSSSKAWLLLQTYYLPNIHPKYWQKCAIPPLACPGVIPSYFREYSKNRASSPTWQLDTQ